jgi:hypothetical protein
MKALFFVLIEFKPIYPTACLKQKSFQNLNWKKLTQFQKDRWIPAGNTHLMKRQNFPIQFSHRPDVIFHPGNAYFI